MRILSALAGTAAVAAVLAGCAGSAPAGPLVEFTEAASAPVRADAEPDAVITVRVANRGQHKITITAVRPRPEPGLLADYLGHSACRRGCAGEGLWNDPETRRLVDAGLDGVLPVTLDAGNSTTSFVFRLRITDPAAAGRLRDGCWLRMRDVEMSLDDGNTVVVTTPAEPDNRYVAGLHATPARSEVPNGCTPYRSGS